MLDPASGIPRMGAVGIAEGISEGEDRDPHLRPAVQTLEETHTTVAIRISLEILKPGTEPTIRLMNHHATSTNNP
ncbi:hypothetical protein GCM10009067_34920 [Haloarcula sebkhae]|uniref:Uncharacterized protein n=1 Tax=Haloarcula sebkhae TaxID=932660 RepID=A0A830EVS3_9EURY|nr:hypothetical protein GCM10009067_34920 [Haloarcula sebkhae]